MSPGNKSSFSIAGKVVAAGASERFEIPVARLATGSWLSLPVTVLNGVAPGPRLCLSAAIHGDEINGVEIIRRVLDRVDTSALSGTIVALPIVNVYGFLSQSRYTPDRRDVNRCFPGSAKGSLASRLAHLFLDEVVSRCEYGIDLHTGSNQRTNLPQIRANLDDEQTVRLAQVFGAPVMINSRTLDGSLRAAAQVLGIPMLLYEAGETHRFNEGAISVGVRGVLNVMRSLGMYDSPETPSESVKQAHTTRWLRASQSGLFYQGCELGQMVDVGDVLGVITDTYGETTKTLRSPVRGLVIGHVTNPIVNRGEALVHIAI